MSFAPSGPSGGALCHWTCLCQGKMSFGPDPGALSHGSPYRLYTKFLIACTRTLWHEQSQHEREHLDEQEHEARSI